MTAERVAAPPVADRANDRLLFAGCFIALIATSFGFVIRNFIIGDLQIEFGLSETQKGEILGVGLWPFAISIVLFSLIVDKVGYGKSMIFAFVCHVASAIITVFATGYEMLYWGSFICALANGTVEAVINPVVATMYPRKKTKMLTILHAGWPGGIVLGGILTLAMGSADWQIKVLLILIPTAVYGVMLLKPRWPVHERVAAGVPYRDMLREAGALGAFIVSFMVVKEIGRVFQFHPAVVWTIIGVVTLAYLLYTRSLGRPMYIFLLLVMILLAITELGTDAWMKELRDPAMRKLGLSGGWILVYTAGIMMVLRFCIGPIERLLRPLGVLLVSSLFAAAGLYFLSAAEAAGIILITATIYGIGQCYFWPVTLGLVAERFPRGGALTINAIAGVGMLGVGIVGTPLMGYLQDTRIDRRLQQRRALHEELIEPDRKLSVLGRYRSLDEDAVSEIKYKVALYEAARPASTGTAPAATVPATTAPAGALVARPPADPEKLHSVVEEAYYRLVRGKVEQAAETHAEMLAALKERGMFVSRDEYEKLARQHEYLETVTHEAKEKAMANIAVLPLIMAVCYLGLILYFKSTGGYKVIELGTEGKPPGEHNVPTDEAVADQAKAPDE